MSTNIVKPVIDELKAIACADDNLVLEVRAVKRDLAQPYVLANETPDLVSTLAAGTDFVHVTVDIADLLDAV